MRNRKHKSNPADDSNEELDTNEELWKLIKMATESKDGMESFLYYLGKYSIKL